MSNEQQGYTFQRTKLWQLIENSPHPDASAVQTLIKSWMPKIETILREGGTSPKDFTLHDADHSFRVANRMAEVIPANTLKSLSVHELALLLLSAYLHDMGMNPVFKKIVELRTYLLTGERQTLSAQEIEEFVAWLDYDGRATVPLLDATGLSQLERLRLADELLTYYCRYRHNDWSEEWIRTNRPSFSLERYPSWLDDLVTVCKSHHEDYAELRSERFRPVRVGNPAMWVHRRYLAVVLRIADILEFDPERTPEVLIHHREIDPKSKDYWVKDHHVTLDISTQRGLHISAEPPNAYLHKAIQVMANDINRELQGAFNLSLELPFHECGLGEATYHCWDLQPARVRIEPRPGTYHYIDGAFRPDVRKLLGLLSGIELYQNPLAATRELLQNAFDAVREQIALERLQQCHPSDARWEEELARRHRVTLRFELTPEGPRLVCTDDGVGMTKEIIENHLLVSGSNKRHDVLALERKCQAHGFSIGRTGQFGVGLLSYFMLAKRIAINTRRSLEAEGDSAGWRFETTGIGTFGELRSVPRRRVGTEVELLLRSDIVGADAEAWYKQLRQYLVDTLVHLSCHFELVTTLPNCPELIVPPGWIRSTEDQEHLLWSGIERYLHPRQEVHDEYVNDVARETRKQRQHHLQEVKNDFQQNLAWKQEEGDLPGGLGRYRVLLPFFDLLGGRALAFLRIQRTQDECLLHPIGRADAIAWRHALEMSWRGMAVQPGNAMKQFEDLSAFVQVDWRQASAGTLAVSRNQCKLSSAAMNSLRWLKNRIWSLQRETCSPDPIYSHLNTKVAANPRERDDVASHWVVLPPGPEDRPIWGPLSFPATNLDMPDRPLTWNGKVLPMIPPLMVYRPRWSADSETHTEWVWHPHTVAPDRVVAAPSGTPALLWLTPPASFSAQSSPPTSLFPPAWAHLCGFEGERFRFIWNQNHALVKAVTEAGWQWASTTLTAQNPFRPFAWADAILSDRGCAAAWVMCCIERNLAWSWQELCEAAPELVKRVWHLVFDPAEKENEQFEVCTFHSDFQDTINVFSEGGTRSYDVTDEDYGQIRSTLLPDPGPEWQLTVGE